MNASVQLTVDDLLARAEIGDLLARYARGVDRRDWALVRSCYHPAAFDDHGLYQGGVDGLMEFLQALAGTLRTTTHQLGNQLISLDETRSVAQVETYCLGSYVRTSRNGNDRLIQQGLRYLDRVERGDDGWQIAHRRVVLDWEHLAASGDQPAVATSWLRGDIVDNDPSRTWP